jgi:hypothetical protein
MDRKHPSKPPLPLPSCLRRRQPAALPVAAVRPALGSSLPSCPAHNARDCNRVLDPIDRRCLESEGVCTRFDREPFALAAGVDREGGGPPIARRVPPAVRRRRYDPTTTSPGRRASGAALTTSSAASAAGDRGRRAERTCCDKPLARVLPFDADRGRNQGGILVCYALPRAAASVCCLVNRMVHPIEGFSCFQAARFRGRWLARISPRCARLRGHQDRAPA